jgi:hypothetical protein
MSLFEVELTRIDECWLFSITYSEQEQYKFSSFQRTGHTDTESKDADDGKFSSLRNFEYFLSS